MLVKPTRARVYVELPMVERPRQRRVTVHRPALQLSRPRVHVQQNIRDTKLNQLPCFHTSLGRLFIRMCRVVSMWAAALSCL